MDNSSLFPIRIKHAAAAVALLALMFAANLYGTRHKSVSYDEPANYKYGSLVFAGNTDRIDDSKMPVTALNVAAVRASQAIAPDKSWLFSDQIKAGRIATMLASVMLGFIVFWWAGRLYGSGAGLFALVLYALSPTVQAHARWITTDLYSALGITLALYAFWRYMNAPSKTKLIAAAVCLGLAQLTKFTAVHLYPLFALIAVMRFAAAPGGVKNIAGSVWRFLIAAAVMIAVSFAVINAGYLFNGTGTPFSSFEFKSDLFKAIQTGLGSLSRLPVPLPGPYIEGFDWIHFNEVSNAYRGPAYFFGQLRQGTFFWYYPAVFLFKVPLAVLALAGWSLFRHLKHRTSFAFLRNEIFLIVPVFYLMVYFQFLFKAQVGIRLLVVFFPLIHILCASLLKNAASAGSRFKVAVAGLVAALMLSVYSYYPHWTSYFSVLAGDRRTNYRILCDSNLDWGQNEWYADRYLQEHPGTLKNPTNPVFGRVIVSANFLTGIVYPTEFAWYRWVRENLKPQGHVAYSYLVYDVPRRVMDETSGYYEN